MDLSLDEIIKKKNIKIGSQKLKGRSQNGRRNMSTGRVNKPVQSNNGRVTRPLRRTNSQIADNPRVVDARLRIIQKNRQRMTDARDKLSELAKQTDARNKIKGRNPKLAVQPNGRTDRGRINRDNFIRTLKSVPLLKRSFRNNVAEIADPAALIRTINRPNLNYMPRSSPLYVDDFDMSSPMRPHTDLSGIKVVTQNEYMQYNQEYVPEPMFVDHHDAPVFRRHLDNPRGGITVPHGRSGGRMSQEMRARLDSPKPPPAYIYPPPSHSPPLSPGHRIVVSNLHASVTHEDIKELFEDIGPLLTSRLVRPGTAEVIYKEHKNAKQAVEAYHNRQLDGQPMKCLLVNPRSPSAGGVLRSNNIPAAPKYPSSSKSMVVPDLSAIHKALFTNK
ncbi:polymerase delta-interacting protein 3-like isoform X2 [Homalodisca vitripennis]|uniref:polymerase delta-interacting protein 3-like isoform X2 n=1 Tax=Homalodisca vitripennis TaxID=197043 RepID=UPI001EEB4637|nr:polymerase delta-interacting protein 3-like isoform X2 [Homalodisca vitripennis]